MPIACTASSGTGPMPLELAVVKRFHVCFLLRVPDFDGMTVESFASAFLSSSTAPMTSKHATDSQKHKAANDGRDDIASSVNNCMFGNKHI